MKKFSEKVISLLPYFILVVLAGTIFSFSYKNDMSYDQLIELIKVLTWPLLVLITIFFFRKVFTYLFFSMEEFNFFGTKGGLKDVEVMIQEQVEKRLKEKNKEEENARTKNALEEKIKTLVDMDKKNNDFNNQWNDLAIEIMEKLKSANKENSDLIKERDQLHEQIAALLTQIQGLQAQLGQRK